VAYAAELQKAGYATDPEYARKLSGAIQSALRAMADMKHPYVATPSPLSQRCAAGGRPQHGGAALARGLWPGLRPQYAAQAARHGT
jgi:hypothetical protein